MTEEQWTGAYLVAQERAESKVGQLHLNEDHYRIINTWIRYGLTKGGAPDMTAIYFGVYNEVPPEGFGEPKGIRAFITRAHEVQGLPPLSQVEGDQIDALSILTFDTCKTMLSSSPKSSGCFSVILCFLVFAWIIIFKF